MHFYTWKGVYILMTIEFIFNFFTFFVLSTVSLNRSTGTQTFWMNFAGYR